MNTKTSHIETTPPSAVVSSETLGEVGLSLVRPSVRFYNSFQAALDEYQDAGEETNPDPRSVSSISSFEHYVDFLNAAEFRNPPYAGLIFWLVDGDTFIGRLLVRHHPDDPQVAPEGSIGYSIRPSARRRGYATWMLTQGVLIAQARNVTPTLAIFDSNTPSLSTARSAGFVLSSKAEGVSFFKLP